MCSSSSKYISMRLETDSDCFLWYPGHSDFSSCGVSRFKSRELRLTLFHICYWQKANDHPILSISNDPTIVGTGPRLVGVVPRRVFFDELLVICFTGRLQVMVSAYSLLNRMGAMALVLVSVSVHSGPHSYQRTTCSWSPNRNCLWRLRGFTRIPTSRNVEPSNNIWVIMNCDMSKRRTKLPKHRYHHESMFGGAA